LADDAKARDLRHQQTITALYSQFKAIHNQDHLRLTAAEREVAALHRLQFKPQDQGDSP
jgi:hypothetical protein